MNRSPATVLVLHPASLPQVPRDGGGTHLTPWLGGAGDPPLLWARPSRLSPPPAPDIAALAALCLLSLGRSFKNVYFLGTEKRLKSSKCKMNNLKAQGCFVLFCVVYLNKLAYKGRDSSPMSKYEGFSIWLECVWVWMRVWV